ncbi:MAG TPA: hypothetical protein VKD91_23200 [Pyrinomonadaceae bacterium]|nr:hypothetical protein [Pyrinomonadaceae bacterium]
MKTRLVMRSALLGLIAALPAQALKVYKTKSEGLAKCDVDWKGYKKSMAGRFLDGCEASSFSDFQLVRDLVLVHGRCS